MDASSKRQRLHALVSVVALILVSWALPASAQCASGFVVCANGCIPAGSTCCPGGGYCSSPTPVCSNGHCCEGNLPFYCSNIDRCATDSSSCSFCTNGGTVCGAGCCAAGSICSSDGTCQTQGNCGAAAYQCGNFCAPNGSVCCASVGRPDKWCPGGTVCVSDGTCASGSGAGGGSSGGAGGGAGASCGAGAQPCGVDHCAPAGNVCCANVGREDLSCPPNHTCESDGTCAPPAGSEPSPHGCSTVGLGPTAVALLLLWWRRRP